MVFFFDNLGFVVWYFCFIFYDDLNWCVSEKNYWERYKEFKCGINEECVFLFGVFWYEEVKRGNISGY